MYNYFTFFKFLVKFNSQLLKEKNKTENQSTDDIFYTQIVMVLGGLRFVEWP